MQKQAVWKYELPVTDRPCIPMRAGAQILHVDSLEAGKIHLWALVNPEEQDIDRYFRVIATGHVREDMIHSSRKYLGTVVDRPLGLVWHVWTD